VPTNYQQTVKASDAASSLSSARAIVTNIADAVSDCRSQYVQLQSWVSKNNAYRAYQTALKTAQKNHSKKLPASVTNPGPQPQKASAMCPPPTAFGIAASDVALPAPGQS
jgi:hypothetical protein